MLAEHHINQLITVKDETFWDWPKNLANEKQVKTFLPRAYEYFHVKLMYNGSTVDVTTEPWKAPETAPLTLNQVVVFL